MACTALMIRLRMTCLNCSESHSSGSRSGAISFLNRTLLRGVVCERRLRTDSRSAPISVGRNSGGRGRAKSRKVVTRRLRRRLSSWMMPRNSRLRPPSSGSRSTMAAAPSMLASGLRISCARPAERCPRADAISPAVVYGMLAGIGILIIAGQFHVMVDDKPRASGLENLIAIPESIWKGIFPPEGTSHHFAALTGLITLGSIVLWNYFRPKSMKAIPGTLVGVVVGTAAVALFHLPVKHVDIPDDIWTAFSLPSTASLARLGDWHVLLTALAVALVASAETLLSAVAVDGMHSGPRANFDKELSAQGVGNMLCGLIGALPMTGVIVRSSANVQAGARSRMSTIFHGIWILAFVLLFPSVLRLIPTASLAAVLVFTGFKLVEAQHVRKLSSYGRMPVLIYLATIAGIVGADLLTGVIIGLTLTIAKILWKASRLQIHLHADDEERSIHVHLQGVATFLRLPQLSSVLESVPSDRVVHLHIQHLYYIDHTCLDLLKSIAAQRVERGSALNVHWEELAHRYELSDLTRLELQRTA
jgi:MFS superfamily sulfate permease-like transporter